MALHSRFSFHQIVPEKNRWGGDSANLGGPQPAFALFVGKLDFYNASACLSSINFKNVDSRVICGIMATIIG